MQVQDEARNFLGVYQSSSRQVVSPAQLLSPAPAQPASLDDMHHRLPPDKHPILQLIAIVQQAILDASPAVKCLRQKRGAKVMVKPAALNERQRIGKGIQWILEACRFRPGVTFPERLAQKILGVLDGSSDVLR